ncbi:MAG TPA: C-terminal binding protein [Lacipirellulaceae bacterium]|nr:C-terminal binding protein [Lacipirellulaceae bacterium]
MAKFRALYTDYPWADAEVERAILAEADCELIESPDNQEETLARLAPGMDALLACWAPVSARVIDAADCCRHIARTGIGLDNIDVSHATERGIVVTNVPNYCTEEVAEHTIALLLALARKVGAYHLATKAGRYDLVADLPVERVAGKTLGLIGLGAIGAAVAAKAMPLGLRVIGTNRSGTAPPGVQWRPLDRVLAESDFLSLHLPLSEATSHLIGAEALARTRPSAYLINTSRGGLVDAAALADALRAGRIAGAALDVQDPEPPDLSVPPWNDPRVIVTPHVAFYSTEATRELRTRVGRQVVDVLRGARPDNVVNPAVLAGR